MKLLIIEDEKQVADNLKEGLEQHRYSVDIAYNGEDGYCLTREFDYDIILLDLMLPDIDGGDLCRKLRDDKNQSFILMLTAKKQLDNIVQGLDCGADDYLTKP
ncbi:MAG: response regulator transcription factor, partial [Actinomycetota bacterium]